MLVPFNVSPLSCTPSVVFFHTTIFTSSRAWGASGFPKQDFYLPGEKKAFVSKHADSTTLRLTSSRRDWDVAQPRSQPYLEVVELIIAQNLVVILVREVENPGQCSCTRGSQLQETNHGDKNRALPSAGLPLLPPEPDVQSPSCTAGSTAQPDQCHSPTGAGRQEQDSSQRRFLLHSSHHGCHRARSMRASSQTPKFSVLATLGMGRRVFFCWLPPRAFPSFLLSWPKNSPPSFAGVKAQHGAPRARGAAPA